MIHYDVVAIGGAKAIPRQGIGHRAVSTSDVIVVEDHTHDDGRNDAKYGSNPTCMQEISRVKLNDNVFVVFLK